MSDSAARGPTYPSKIREQKLIRLVTALAAWGAPDFENVVKDEIQHLDAGLLPLREGLGHSNYVGNGAINAVILNVAETVSHICVKTGVFYAGFNAGSCCADDPTPLNEETEYCEVQFDIDKTTAETRITLVADSGDGE